MVCEAPNSVSRICSLNVRHRLEAMKQLHIEGKMRRICSKSTFVLSFRKRGLQSARKSDLPEQS